MSFMNATASTPNPFKHTGRHKDGRKMSRCMRVGLWILATVAVVLVVAGTLAALLWCN